MTNLLNPKAAMFYLVTLPSFLDPATANPFAWGFPVLVYVGIATSVHLVIVTAAGSAEAFLSHGIGKIVVARVFAVTLVGVAAWLLWSTR